MTPSLISAGGYLSGTPAEELSVMDPEDAKGLRRTAQSTWVAVQPLWAVGELASSVWTLEPPDHPPDANRHGGGGEQGDNAKLFKLRLVTERCAACAPGPRGFGRNNPLQAFMGRSSQMAVLAEAMESEERGGRCFLEAHGSERGDRRNDSSGYANLHDQPTGDDQSLCAGLWAFEEVFDPFAEAIQRRAAAFTSESYIARMAAQQAAQQGIAAEGGLEAARIGLEAQWEAQAARIQAEAEAAAESGGFGDFDVMAALLARQGEEVLMCEALRTDGAGGEGGSEGCESTDSEEGGECDGIVRGAGSMRQERRAARQRALLEDKAARAEAKAEARALRLEAKRARYLEKKDEILRLRAKKKEDQAAVALLKAANIARRKERVEARRSSEHSRSVMGKLHIRKAAK